MKHKETHLHHEMMKKQIEIDIAVKVHQVNFALTGPEDQRSGE